MKNLIGSILLVFNIHFLAFGQDEFLSLSNKCQVTSSPFTKVTVIDNRQNNQTLGFVQVGALNRLAPVKYPGNLADSLAAFFTGNPSAGTSPQQLTILLQELYLSEKTEAMSETGRIRISMRLFAGATPDQFKEIVTIDSIYTFKAVDVTKRLLRSVSEHMCEINALATTSKLINSTHLPLYSLSQLKQLDSLEKQAIPIYQTQKVNPGIYTSYEQFKNNTPDDSFITIDNSNPGNIKVFKWDKNKKRKTRLESRSVYAVSDGNILLKATTIGFYELRKINNDFVYVGQTSFSNSNNVAMWGAAFGLVGAAIASEADRNTQLFRFKINYQKGNSVLISKAGY